MRQIWLILVLFTSTTAFAGGGDECLGATGGVDIGDADSLRETFGDALLERIEQNSSAHSYEFPGKPEDISHMSLADQLGAAVAEKNFQFSSPDDTSVYAKSEVDLNSPSRSVYKVGFSRDQWVIYDVSRAKNNSPYANQAIEAMFRYRLAQDKTFASTVQRPKVIVQETVNNDLSLEYLKSVYSDPNVTNEQLLDGFLKNTPNGKLHQRILNRLRLKPDQIFLKYTPGSGILYPGASTLPSPTSPSKQRHNPRNADFADCADYTD